jgi:aspartate dehydrogenase
MEELLAAAQVGNAHIRVVSGAIGALDALTAASPGGLTNVLHTMRKSPHELLAPEEAARLTTIQEVFRGSARQAARRFPTFLNVAAAVALAGKGFAHSRNQCGQIPFPKSTLLLASLSRARCSWLRSGQAAPD